MHAERLLKQFEEFDPQHVERVFGEEFVLDPPDPAVALAPVKRVAIITEAFLPKVDGVSKSAMLTLQYLQQTGREVLIFAPDISPEQIFGTRVIPLLSVGFPRVPETRMALPNPVIARELHAFKPDLIHLFSPALMSISGVDTGRYMGVPIVANYQTDLPGFAQFYGWDFAVNPLWRWMRYVHNRCHVTLVPSQHSENMLREHQFKRLRRWGRGVAHQRFNPAKGSAAWREKLLNGRDPDDLLCVYVGRLAKEKCVDLLLEVARTPGVALTIIGDGAARDELESLFAGTDTYFTGYLLGDDLPAAFASADAFVFTGPNETFGQVVQEAMASGIPSIVTAHGGVADLVLEGETGLLAQHDTDAFAEKVRILRDDRALAQQMGRRARELAEERSWEATLALLETYYADAIAINDRALSLFGRNTNPLAEIPRSLNAFWQNLWRPRS